MDTTLYVYTLHPHAEYYQQTMQSTIEKMYTYNKLYTYCDDQSHHSTKNRR